MNHQDFNPYPKNDNDEQSLTTKEPQQWPRVLLWMIPVVLGASMLLQPPSRTNDVSTNLGDVPAQPNPEENGRDTWAGYGDGAQVIHTDLRTVDMIVALENANANDPNNSIYLQRTQEEEGSRLVKKGDGTCWAEERRVRTYPVRYKDLDVDSPVYTTMVYPTSCSLEQAFAPAVASALDGKSHSPGVLEKVSLSRCGRWELQEDFQTRRLSDGVSVNISHRNYRFNVQGCSPSTTMERS